jgi:cell division protein ZapA
MSQEVLGTSVEIMGKVYHIKCPEAEVHALQQSAQYLEEKMRIMRDSGVMNIDRAAVITALNVVHQLLSLEQQKNTHFQQINQRLSDLQHKVERALSQDVQLELQPAK